MVTPVGIAALVREAADEISAALHIPSFADAVCEVLSDSFEDAAAAMFFAIYPDMIV